MSRTGEQPRLAPLQWDPYGPGGLPPHLCNDSDDEPLSPPGELVRGLRRARTIGEFIPFTSGTVPADEDEDNEDDEDEHQDQDSAQQPDAQGHVPGRHTASDGLPRNDGDTGIRLASGWMSGATRTSMPQYAWPHDQFIGAPAPVDVVGSVPPGIFGRDQGEATGWDCRNISDAKAPQRAPMPVFSPPGAQGIGHGIYRGSHPADACPVRAFGDRPVSFEECPQSKIWKSYLPSNDGGQTYSCEAQYVSDRLVISEQASHESCHSRWWTHGDFSQALDRQSPEDIPRPVEERQHAETEDDDGSDSMDANTTMMVQNIPRRTTREEFLNVLQENGFAGTFDYCYLPRSFNSSSNKGYAFVNFIDVDVAQHFRQTWHLSYMLGADKRPRQKPLRVTRAAVQGRCNNLRVASSKKMSRIRNASCRPLVL